MTVRPADRGELCPAASRATAVYTWSPGATSLSASAHLPSGPAVAVPSTVSPSKIVTVECGSASPLICVASPPVICGATGAVVSIVTVRVCDGGEATPWAS